MDLIMLKLPKDAKHLGGDYYRVGRRVYQEADDIDYATGEVRRRVFRDIRYEYHDPTPIQVPIYLKRAETTDQRIKRLMNEQRAWEAWCKRVDENPDDFDDFDFVEQPMFTSKYEDYLDMRRESQAFSDDDVKAEKAKRAKKAKQTDIEEYLEEEEEVTPKPSPKKSTNFVDKMKSKIGHNSSKASKEELEDD